ncbi:DUF883 family protein [Undibacterium sp. TS12]|uniref:DUF883 family protein n=1 Tax=Undibacterium sp. TS12 TaxID=2908202 RepID=UPI001F4C597D|nr:DUF883 family protein [Undibacterium sp. TS12]MCH8619375.1 DUF883 family protein [Undibacterium sp. TS12]
MLESNLQAINHDVKLLLKDAQALFADAATLSGEKAEEARQRGMRMLDSAQRKLHEVHNSAIEAGKKVARSTDDYVKENPWCAITVAAGAGVLLGLILREK